MPQEFLAIKCCNCSTYQVQLTKKDSKFTCSVCGFKQPLARVYARSFKAADCRRVVQAYNTAQTRDHLEGDATLENAQADHISPENAQAHDQRAAQGASAWPTGAADKWGRFVSHDQVRQDFMGTFFSLLEFLWRE